MKKTTFVALLVLFAVKSFAETAVDPIQAVESGWATVYYATPKQQQEAAYTDLLKEIEQLSIKEPDSTELLYWKAVILSSRAEKQDAFSALKSINTAKDLLAKVIEKNPRTANGSAYVVLGTLYYLVPKWPIAFGDNDKAKELFQSALKINPNGIDSNYFYGDFLLGNNDIKQAQTYFEKALSAPIRKEQPFADNKLKNEVKLALQNAKNRKISSGKNAFFSLFNSASLK